MKNRFPPKNIFVGVDLSEPSLTALDAAISLAKRFGARLSVEYVEPPPIPPDPTGTVPWIPYDDRARERWQKRVEALTRGLEPAARLKVESGVPEAVLARRAAARSADLVVLGTHGRRGGQRFFLGSVAESVVHRARVPVLTLRAGAKFAPKRILAPCHMRRYADEALFYAMKLAEAFGAQVCVLYVPPEKEWELDSELKARMHLEEAFGTHAANSLTVKIRRGEPREQILAEARDGGYDLVALSAHMRGTLSDLALGTTAERTIRACELPVLAVPAAEVSASSRARAEL